MDFLEPILDIIEGAAESCKTFGGFIFTILVLGLIVVAIALIIYLI